MRLSLSLHCANTNSFSDNAKNWFQVIVNKSRAEWRAIVTKIPLQINDLDKIPQISNDIKSMLRSHSKVFLGKDAPYCFLSRIESSFAELTLGCNLKHMVVLNPLEFTYLEYCLITQIYMFLLFFLIYIQSSILLR